MVSLYREMTLSVSGVSAGTSYSVYPGGKRQILVHFVNMHLLAGDIGDYITLAFQNALGTTIDVFRLHGKVPGNEVYMHVPCQFYVEPEKRLELTRGLTDAASHCSANIVYSVEEVPVGASVSYVDDIIAAQKESPLNTWWRGLFG